jgi:L-aminopeptidase/D-esterase-like protein
MHQDFGEFPMMFYLVKCELVKIAPNGQEYVFTTGYGSANTREKRNGRNGAFDAANSCIKMAQKRALTSAALSISGLSSMFTQDMDNEDFVNSNIAALSATNNPNAPITRKQMNLLYAKAGNLGLTAQQAKARMAEAGYASVKGITQKEYDTVLALFATPAEKEAQEAQRGDDND